MRIAVLTLTRDRLAYSQHCFQTFRENAGCDFDWYIVDQGSTDGTAEWLEEDDSLDVTFLNQNIGICAGLNLMLDEAVNTADYDVICRYDNDGEVLQPDTLKIVAELACEYQTILAPRVLGLRNPPPTLSRFQFGDWWIDETAILGGIFMAIPADLFTVHGYRFNEQFPPWTGDEDVCRWWRDRGGRCGYVDGLAVNHYLTSEGQENDDVPYFDRKLTEMAVR